MKYLVILDRKKIIVWQNWKGQSRSRGLQTSLAQNRLKQNMQTYPPGWRGVRVEWVQFSNTVLLWSKYEKKRNQSLANLVFHNLTELHHIPFPCPLLLLGTFLHKLLILVLQINWEGWLKYHLCPETLFHSCFSKTKTKQKTPRKQIIYLKPHDNKMLHWNDLLVFLL